MKIRKAAWRLVAGVLILILAGAGAVPAKTVCQGGCTCYRQTSNRLHVHRPDHGTSHGIHGPTVTRLHPSQILIDMSTQHPVCQTLPVETCRMSETYPLGVLQRAASGAFQTDNSLDDVSVPFLCQTVDIGRSVSGGDLIRWSIPDHPHIPLYLQHLSFIC